MSKVISAADLFCGAGGTSVGMVRALTRLGYKTSLTVVNHWKTAIATHLANHPTARHRCASLDALNPRDLFGDNELDLLWASPECTHHSVARGGKPINDQSRATAWCVIRWAEALRPPVILVENVKEFESWGTIGSDNQPLKSKKGTVFQSWVGCLEAIGYQVDWRVLRAADYGDPTTRERLFVQAVRGRRKITWPNPTHAQVETSDLLGHRKAWRTAREIIDWNIEGQSIFDRKKPLSEKTMARIWAGLEKFGLKPFIVPQSSYPEPRGVDQPVNTVVAQGSGHKLAEPYLVKLRGTTKSHIKSSSQPISEPVPTITTSHKFGVAEPFLVQVSHGNGDDKNGNKRRTKSVDDPLPTVCGQRGEWAVCEPALLPQQSAGVLRPVSEPAPTIATAGAVALVQPFILPHEGVHKGNAARSLDKPLQTVTATHGGGKLIQPFIVSIDHTGGNGKYVRSTETPLSAVTTENRHAVVEPFLICYNRTGNATGVSEPVKSITTKERFGLVRPVVEIDGERYLLDIHFRMLQPHELAQAQGFPKDYKFTGNKTEQVKQIGNAVPCGLSEALVLAVMTQNPKVNAVKEAA